MARYAIWNKEDNIFTPSGEMFTPEQWITRYQWINANGAVPVISGELPFNGALIGELNNMKARCEREGAVFADGLSNEELLAAIEAFEDEINTPATEETTISDATRTADALEDLVLLQELAMETAE